MTNKQKKCFVLMLLGCILIVLFQLIFRIGNQSSWQLIIIQLRLPRLIFELGTGFAIGLSALLLAATLRQPYLDGSMIGIASGSELMIALITVLFPSSLTYRVLIGTVAGILCLLLLRGSIFKYHNHVLFLVIGGFCLAMFFNALTTILTESSGWTGKSLANVTWLDVSWLFLIVSLVIASWRKNSRYLQYFALPELQTKQLGIDEAKIAMNLQLIAAALLGAVTAVLGTVFFAGVIINQLVREYTHLGIIARIPFVITFSILDVLLADTVAHFIFYPTELPTNAVLLVLLAPAFLLLLMRWSRAV
ncbi:iron chelate uptake ABC transporter family permease subunit [Liquorilactobacillus hordei]|uniref:Ferrichrome ABC transporter permease n=1 Tax=Liquorilactobacillus hordei DSM 19519 TaxID=1423759 RepID=A0A0R1MM39_9LACO|nr:iron chelate uptake ABC transporter family permease subunit [Liquorilactobacillus hordei]KRL06266.1 ferrichrome ABC transporter permease [Liquorilactobacillus hordei DSM 19519]QYH52964.1 iron ABC transporter permease [Liquorilactobacillus hordei DSM 19519]